MKVVVAIDSFKGSLSSLQAGNAVKDAIMRLDKSCEVLVKPLADGGEGTVDALASGFDSEVIELTVMGPLLNPVVAKYCILKKTNTAVIEMASASGITLISAQERNPLKTTTYGVGQVMRHAVESGCTEILLGLGGSATNDGGCGCAAAMGVKFFDEQGNQFVPLGKTMGQIAKIDVSEAKALLELVGAPFEK